MTTEAQKSAFTRYEAKRKKVSCLIRLPIVLRDAIKSAAAEHNLTTEQYLTKLIKKEI